MSRPRVLFVSKAVAPPFHDGAACLVRDLCAGLSRCEATIMTTRGGPQLGEHIHHAPIYATHSRFSPALRDNARVFGHVLADRRHDLWHFVFAPNPLSSRAGTMLRTLRSVPIVQTVASQPRSFDHVERLLFGDRVVALSRYTADRLVQAGVAAARIAVVPPPIADVARSEADRTEALRAAGLLAGVPTFLYPGDLEFSGGASTVARAAASILRDVPRAQLVFACRAKTDKAKQAQAVLSAELQPHGDRVRFVGEVPDLPALIGAATAVLFPVDDLFGKVDLPYAVLEAALLQVPVVVADRGPLAELSHAPAIAPGDAAALAQWCVRIARDEALRAQIGAALRQSVRSACAPEVVAAAYEDIYDELASAKVDR